MLLVVQYFIENIDLKNAMILRGADGEVSYTDG